jgi:hypothetical protein
VDIKEPVWWAGLFTKPEREWIFAFFYVRAGITTEDTIYLERVVERRDGQKCRRAAAILASMLRGRFPAIMERREDLARKMLALAKDGYPESERARSALSVLTYANHDAASQLIQEIDFSRPLPSEYREVVAWQLSAINTDASVSKLDELLAAQNDPKLFVSRSTRRYVPMEELGRQWQENHDLGSLERLAHEWIHEVYEGYPLDLVTDIMGPPQHSGPHYAYYVTKEGATLYLEINDAGQIGGRKGP